MDRITVYSNKEPMSREYFSKIFEILEYSFPKTEHRSENEHFAEFDKQAFRSMVLDDGNNSIKGFMNYWELNGFIYLEHFAVAKEMRGQGLGTYLMGELKKTALDRPLILEADPPGESEVASRRVRFYERLGFVLNKYRYFQPPYSADEQPLPLSVMSYPKGLSPEEFVQIRDELYRGAYDIPEGSDLFSAKF